MVLFTFFYYYFDYKQEAQCSIKKDVQNNIFFIKTLNESYSVNNETKIHHSNDRVVSVCQSVCHS